VAEKYRGQTDLNIRSDDKYRSFYIFNELIVKDLLKTDTMDTRKFLWDEIKTYFRTFDEWYQNNEYYHLVGFLTQSKTAIETIKKLSENNRKDDFLIALKGEIKKAFGKKGINKDSLLELEYGENSDVLKNLLLLFNVVTCMESKYTRFPFDRYVTEQWSLEHIHAQNSQLLKNDHQRRLLLEEQKRYFSHGKQDFCDEIDALLKNIDVNRFEALQEKIFEVYSDGTDIHSIQNLALLEKNDNSSLNNDIFPIKRNRIKELDETGSFIPVCTKNVFLKYYSKNVEQNVKWDKADMEAYLAALKETLNNYLLEGEKTI
jgi:hypothetical protein